MAILLTTKICCLFQSLASLCLISEKVFIEFEMKLQFVLGQKTKNVTVSHVERPDVVWVSPPSTEETDAFLQQVSGIRGV